MFVAVRAIAPVAANAAEERRDDVADALRDQLGVGVVPRAGHAVGDDRAEQRLDRAEHRDRERRAGISSRRSVEARAERLRRRARAASTASAKRGGSARDAARDAAVRRRT